MKKFLVVVLIAISIQPFAQEKVVLEKPSIDKRVELLSIVFRLAERREYSSSVFKLYTDRIERHFNQYKNHDLIRFTKSIMNERGLGYDAVAWMSIYLDDSLNLLTNVKYDLWQRDSRWTKEDVEKFIPLLKKFAKDTHFDEFFNENIDLYNEAIKRFAPLYEPLDLNWYFTFYGKEPSETFSIKIGMSNGMSNYGPSLDYFDGNRKVYTIVGVGLTDSTGMPKFDYNALASLIIIHEFNHSFVNYLVDNNIDELRESGEKIFSVVKDVMTKQAYGSWKIMMYEALVRAAVIKYMKDHDFDQQMLEGITNWEKECGFYWIEELVKELESYDKQRDQYPTLESYMPKLVESYKIWVDYVQGIEEKRPVVVSINEFANGNMNVNPETKTITFNFSVPLSGKGYSVNYGNKGQGAFPKVEGINYANENKSVIMQVNLERDKEYQFILVGRNFTSIEGIGIKDYEVNFKTDK